MAVILGETFPELYKGVGAHSGLPYRAAHDVVSAFSAMGAGAQQTTLAKAAPKPVRTIVFHGDRDTTVNPDNGDAIVRRAAAAFEGAEPLRAETLAGNANGGGYARTVYRGPDGRPEVEHWVVHGAAHAWSGGDARGSYAVARGPDASDEMLRFFMARGA
jgi:poly(3-hydroxybutyrate) depolymerase